MIVVISGPSGVGKSSIIKELSVNKDLYFCVSSTTRPIRTNEVDGIDYKFIDNDKFQSMINSDLFIEYEEYGNYLYGTSKEELLKKNEFKCIILDLEVNGALHILQKYSESYGIFVDISDELIKERLQKRGHNDVNFINTRLSLASKQRKHMDSFDYVVINKEIKLTVKKINDIIYNEIL
tara:strand:- start:418 stop:957 length:540 start_codon:yes stop_codon:yes gene_type:complete